MDNISNTIKKNNISTKAVYLSTDPHIFVGRKPIAIIFDNDYVDVKSWRETFIQILMYCNNNKQHHETLLYLRDKVSGKCRTFLSHSPNGMKRPAKIDEDMYAETHYGSQTLMHILVQRILLPVQFDYSKIKIVIKF